MVLPDHTSLSLKLKFLFKGVVKLSLYEDGQVISPVFVRPKKDGSLILTLMSVMFRTIYQWGSTSSFASTLRVSLTRSSLCQNAITFGLWTLSWIT